MPEYEIPASILDITRDTILLDTNVLVAAFMANEDERRQEIARVVVHEDATPLLIPSVVVVEAWGLMVGSRKDRLGGMAFLHWLNTPGRATVVPPHRTEFTETRRLMDALRVDCVDAMLAELATDITERLSLRPELPIATFDTGDFTRLSGNRELRFSIFDMKTFELVEFNRTS